MLVLDPCGMAPARTNFTAACGSLSSHATMQEHHRIVEAGWDGEEGPAAIGTTTLVIVTERHPTRVLSPAAIRNARWLELTRTAS